MALEIFERETAIGFDDSTEYAQITTFNRALMNRLDKFCKEFPEDYKYDGDIIVDGKVEGKEYTCLKRRIRFGKPRVMTKTQKKDAAKRLSKARKKASKTGAKKK